ncbi:MAG: ATP-binding cassette domain-containing protein [Streptosporangiales bacterium]|nr:ATP-binding cassette domain-containing protein [Streptosporangiales bacterium]
MVAIEAAGLRKSFGKVEALRGVDLAVPEGGVCALLGPNGAGKTTAIRILATLTPPDAGTARVAGHDVIAEPRRVREAIGLAGQHAAVDDDLSGWENLFIIGLMLHLGRRRARARATELLERFGLDGAGNRLVKTWSGGMRRRLDLIASLVVEPEILFLDEPTTGLDPRSRAEIWSAVRELAASGTTILLTTQYLDEADRLASQIVIIDAGRVTLQGRPGELKDRIGGRVDVVLADGAAGEPAWTAAETVLRGIAAGDLAADRDTRSLTAPVKTGAITLPELVRRLDAAGVDVEDVSVRKPTLDEVFLAGTETAA